MPQPTDHHRALLAAPRRGEEGYASVQSLWPTVVALAALLVLVALLEWAGVDVRGWLRDRIVAGT